MNELLMRFGFTEAEITDFWANGQTIKYHKRDLLVEDNQINRYLYLVKTGVIRAYVTDNEGKQYTKSFFFGAKKDLAFSYRSFTLQEPSNIVLEAVTDCEVCAWAHSYIQKLLDNDVRFFKYYKYCTDTLYFRFEKRETYLLRATPEERYLDFIKTNPQLINIIPLQHIASFLGVTPETLSRIRKRLGNN